MSEQQIRETLGEVRENFDPHALPLDADFGESGLDSLDHAALLLALQEKSGIEFPEDASALNSIKAIMDYMREHA